MQGRYDAEIKHQYGNHGTLNPVPHRNPDDGDERQVEQLIRPQRPTEHDPQNTQYSGRLRNSLGQAGHLHLSRFCGWRGRGLWRETSSNPGKNMYEQEWSKSQQGDHVAYIPAEGGLPIIGPGDGVI